MASHNVSAVYVSWVYCPLLGESAINGIERNPGRVISIAKDEKKLKSKIESVCKIAGGEKGRFILNDVQEGQIQDLGTSLESWFDAEHIPDGCCIHLAIDQDNLLWILFSSLRSGEGGLTEQESSEPIAELIANVVHDLSNRGPKLSPSLRKIKNSSKKGDLRFEKPFENVGVKHLRVPSNLSLPDDTQEDFWRWLEKHFERNRVKNEYDKFLDHFINRKLEIHTLLSSKNSDGTEVGTGSNVNVMERLDNRFTITSLLLCCVFWLGWIVSSLILNLQNNCIGSTDTQGFDCNSELLVKKLSELGISQSEAIYLFLIFFSISIFRVFAAYGFVYLVGQNDEKRKVPVIERFLRLCASASFKSPLRLFYGIALYIVVYVCFLCGWSFREHWAVSEILEQFNNYLRWMPQKIDSNCPSNFPYLQRFNLLCLPVDAVRSGAEIVSTAFQELNQKPAENNVSFFGTAKELVWFFPIVGTALLIEAINRLKVAFNVQGDLETRKKSLERLGYVNESALQFVTFVSWPGKDVEAQSRAAVKNRFKQLFAIETKRINEEIENRKSSTFQRSAIVGALAAVIASQTPLKTLKPDIYQARSATEIALGAYNEQFPAGEEPQQVSMGRPEVWQASQSNHDIMEHQKEQTTRDLSAEVYAACGRFNLSKKQIEEIEKHETIANVINGKAARCRLLHAQLLERFEMTGTSSTNTLSFDSETLKILEDFALAISELSKLTDQEISIPAILHFEEDPIIKSFDELREFVLDLDPLQLPVTFTNVVKDALPKQCQERVGQFYFTHDDHSDNFRCVTSGLGNRPHAVCENLLGSGKEPPFAKDSQEFAIVRGQLSDLLRDLKTENAARDTTYIALGYTDHVGSILHNLDLAEKRAETVKRLLTRGSGSTVWPAVGFGEFDIAGERIGKSYYVDPKHRRVDLFICSGNQAGSIENDVVQR